MSRSFVKCMWLLFFHFAWRFHVFPYFHQHFCTLDGSIFFLTRRIHWKILYRMELTHLRCLCIYCDACIPVCCLRCRIIHWVGFADVSRDVVTVKRLVYPPKSWPSQAAHLMPQASTAYSVCFHPTHRILHWSLARRMVAEKIQLPPFREHVIFLR